jgi:hypothetical protein
MMRRRCLAVGMNLLCLTLRGQKLLSVKGLEGVADADKSGNDALPWNF